MTKKKKKESWKEKRRQAAIKHQKALESERLRREGEPRKSKGWSKGKIFGVAFMFLLIIGIYGAWQYTQSSPSGNSNVNRQKAPLFTLKDIDGKTVALEDLTGRVVILNLFDTHCPPCVAEIPYLKELHEQYSSDNLMILSIDVDPYHDTVELLQQFRDNNQIAWPILVGTASVADDYSIQYTPTTVLVDRQGFIYKTHIGWNVDSSPSELSTEIEYLLSN
ncbi:TlpA family protein disulfide reductase [Candidatus Bathyarchaeota archaeon]|nr:MAG: TlpA family protein disulfide reductase [Candidatus Bathyarchaeota archaeon]